MFTIDDRAVALPRRAHSRSHDRQRSRDWHPSTESGTYGDVVSPPQPSKDPRIRLFAQFIRRALEDARDRGLSIEDVEAAIRDADPDAKVGRSTIYRWRRAEIDNPQRKQVQAFCRGLGLPATTAAQILGWDDSRQPTDPDPAVDPDIRAILRKLVDPHVPAEQKTSIRATLRYLAKQE